MALAAIEEEDSEMVPMSNKEKSRRATAKEPIELVEDESDEELCDDLDLLVDNPQKKLFCILCKQHGEREVTGRLIPFHINQFVHVNCALWTREVKETTDGELLNFYFAQKKFRGTRCQICKLPGATLFCTEKRNKKCNVAYHFPCAYNSKRVYFDSSPDIVCEFCAPKVGLNTPHFPLKSKGIKRRIQIVKNITPQQTDLFNDICSRAAKHANNL